MSLRVQHTCSCGRKMGYKPPCPKCKKQKHITEVRMLRKENEELKKKVANLETINRALRGA